MKVITIVLLAYIKPPFAINRDADENAEDRDTAEKRIEHSHTFSME